VQSEGAPQQLRVEQVTATGKGMSTERSGGRNAVEARQPARALGLVARRVRLAPVVLLPVPR